MSIIWGFEEALDTSQVSYFNQKNGKLVLDPTVDLLPEENQQRFYDFCLQLEQDPQAFADP
jgi:hypothetical protein